MRITQPPSDSCRLEYKRYDNFSSTYVSTPIPLLTLSFQTGKDAEKAKLQSKEDEDPIAGPSSRARDSSSASSGDEDTFRGGLGAASKQPKRKTTKGSSGFAGGAGGKRVQLDQGSGQIAGMRSANYTPHMNLGKGFGDWEKHTKGIGAKLLLQMGYESGRGLGKNLQGRSEIVEAHLRKGRGAIGAYGREGGSKKGKKADSEEEEEKEFREKLHQWKRGGAGSKKVKYVYKTADQVLEEGKWRKISKGDGPVGDGKASKVKVVDMRGKEERVLSGYHAISAKQRRPEADSDEDDGGQGDGPAAALMAQRKPNFEIPELLHNINLIMDTCEEDLIAADRKLRHHRDRVEVLQMEEEKLANLVDAEKEQLDQLKSVLDIVEELEAAHEAKDLDLETAMNKFRRMSRDYPKEYQVYELPHIASTIVAPLIRARLSDWRPLEQPQRHRDLFLAWKEILGSGLSGRGGPDPFYNLVWEAMMPSLRSAMSQWSTRDPDSMIDFLKAWGDVIPSQILHNLHNMMILPKLQTDVEQWNPLTDPVPIHSWLHPWLEVLGQQLEIVYPTIRQKLASALQAWHPSDRSARLILLPWKDVFDRTSMQAFLLKNICQKLELCLHELVINPAEQEKHMAEWNYVVDWKDFLSPAVLVAMLEKAFFPKWRQVLATWLTNGPNYNEVSRWYQGWKKELAGIPGLLDHQQVQMYLNQALEMMNRSASGGSMAMQPGAMEEMRYLASRDFKSAAQAPAAPPQPPPPRPSVPSGIGTTMPESLKDLISQRCAQRNIWFTPVPNRTYEGKQVYKCGNVNVYLGRNEIYALRNGRWEQVDLSTLLDEAL